MIQHLLFERVLFSQLKPGKYYIEYKHGGLLYEYKDVFIGFDGYEAIFNDIVCLSYHNWRYYKMISRKHAIQQAMEQRAFQKVMKTLHLDLDFNYFNYFSNIKKLKSNDNHFK